MRHGKPILAWVALLAAAGACTAGARAQEKPKAAPTQAAAKGEANRSGPEKTPDPAVAERSYSAGAKAFEAGRYAEAIQSLSQALAGGGLPSQQMAKALLLRGIAYRKDGKPALAISDLTTAAWLKGGLSEADRTQALENRQLAYLEAGLGESPPPMGAAPLDAPATTPAASASKPAPGVVASAPVQSSSFWNSLLPWSTSSPAAKPTETAAASQGAAAAPAQATASGTPEGASTASAATPAPRPAAEVSVAELTTASLSGAVGDPPAPPAPSPSASESAAPGADASAAQTLAPESTAAPAGGGPALGSLFSTVLTSPAPTAPKAEKPAETPVTTGSTAGAETASAQQWSEATVVATAPESGRAAESLPWTTGTTAPSEKAASGNEATPSAKAQATARKVKAAEKPTAPERKSAGVEKKIAAAETKPDVGEKKAAIGETKPDVAEKSAATAAPAATPLAPRAQTYNLQVAAVRSREEAERLVASLKKYQALHNGAVSPAIDETVMGSMGTFYRVRLGPYADATEPGQLCKTLKPQGFDCLVFTQ
jgi:hypothetical protein